MCTRFASKPLTGRSRTYTQSRPLIGRYRIQYSFRPITGRSRTYLQSRPLTGHSRIQYTFRPITGRSRTNTTLDPLWVLPKPHTDNGPVGRSRNRSWSQHTAYKEEGRLPTSLRLLGSIRNSSRPVVPSDCFGLIAQSPHRVNSGHAMDLGPSDHPDIL